MGSPGFDRNRRENGHFGVQESLPVGHRCLGTRVTDRGLTEVPTSPNKVQAMLAADGLCICSVLERSRKQHAVHLDLPPGEYELASQIRVSNRAVTIKAVPGAQVVLRWRKFPWIGGGCRMVTVSSGGSLNIEGVVLDGVGVRLKSGGTASLTQCTVQNCGHSVYDAKVATVVKIRERREATIRERRKRREAKILAEKQKKIAATERLASLRHARPRNTDEHRDNDEFWSDDYDDYDDYEDEMEWDSDDDTRYLSQAIRIEAHAVLHMYSCKLLDNGPEGLIDSAYDDWNDICKSFHLQGGAILAAKHSSVTVGACTFERNTANPVHIRVAHCLC